MRGYYFNNKKIKTIPKLHRCWHQTWHACVEIYTPLEQDLMTSQNTSGQRLHSKKQYPKTNSWGNSSEPTTYHKNLEGHWLFQH